MFYVSNNSSAIGDVPFMTCAFLKYFTYTCQNFADLKSTRLIAGKLKVAWSETGVMCLKVCAFRNRISKVLIICLLFIHHLPLQL